MKKLGIKIIGVLIVVVILLQGTTTFATTQSQLNAAEKKVNEAKEELKEIGTEKSAAQKQVEELTGQISEYEIQIRALDDSIKELNQKISQEEENLKKIQEDYTKQEELLEARLVATYEAGETSYLDFILSSSSITDLISNYYLVSEIATSDTELLEKIEKQKKTVEEAKQSLENSKKELDTSKASKQSVATQLQDSKNQKNAQVAKLTEEEKKTQAELDQFEKDKNEIREELRREALRQQQAAAAANKGNSSSSGSGSTGGTISNPSASGFVFPVAGLGKGNIRNKTYPSYRGHTGIDININVVGKTIVAAKGGTVQRSQAYIRNGQYYSYGECIVINHGGGVATLYAHGLAGSRRVTVGQTVQQGQAIMTVGSTGNSTGAHLHFEVLINGNPVNPLPYLP